jgi:hypothetical protein
MRSSESVGLSSFPCTVPMSQRIAGAFRARSAASEAGVLGSISLRASSLIRARPFGVTLPGLPTSA